MGRHDPSKQTVMLTVEEYSSQDGFHIPVDDGAASIVALSSQTSEPTLFFCQRQITRGGDRERESLSKGIVSKCSSPTRRGLEGGGREGDR